MPPKGSLFLSVKLDRETNDWLRSFAEENGINISEAVRFFLDQVRGIDMRSSGYRAGREIGYATVLEAVQTAVSDLPSVLPDSEKLR